MKRRVQCDLRRQRGADSHHDHLYDDPSPQPKHAEAVVQWQSQARWLMWVAAFALALWHSGDSKAVARPSRALLTCVNDKRPCTES